MTRKIIISKAYLIDKAEQYLIFVIFTQDGTACRTGLETITVDPCRSSAVVLPEDEKVDPVDGCQEANG